MKIAKESNGFSLVCSGSETEKNQIIYLIGAIKYGELSLEELQKLSQPKFKLIDLIEKTWTTTILWLIISPTDRYKDYPFNEPCFRSFVKAYQPWFDLQEATYFLCAAVHASSPTIREVFGNYFALFGAYMIQHRKAMIDGVLSEQEDTISKEANRQFKALNSYEDWLSKPEKFPHGNPKDESLWGGILGEILFAARDLKNNDPVKFWLKQNRKWNRYRQRTKSLHRACANDKEIYRITPKGRRRIAL